MTPSSEEATPGDSTAEAGDPDTILARLERAYQLFGLAAAPARAAALADIENCKPDSSGSPSRPIATSHENVPPRWLIVSAFAAVYLVWGSTYLVIRYAIETIPPFLTAGTRFLVAGVFLYAFARLRGAAKPRLIEWRDAAIVGGLLLFMGNGGVTWAEQTVPSAVAALVVALIPLWIVLIDWLRAGGKRPGKITFAGLALGFGGIALIVAATQPGGGRLAEPVGATVLVIGSLAWAIGSVFSRHARKPSSPLLMVGMQMIAGGLILLLASLGSNEFAAFDWRVLSGRSALAWGYLTLAGSVIAFTAYIWLLQVSTPSRVATYAYVNPVIAVALGCSIGGEPFSSQMLIGATLVVMAVVLILRAPKPVTLAATGIKQVATPAAGKQAC